MQGTLLAIHRYPIKSLSAEPLAEAALTKGRALPWDRVFAIAPAQTQFDSARPQWLARKNFLYLAQNSFLSALRQSFDESTPLLRLSCGGLSAAANPVSSAGRAQLSSFLRGVLPAARSDVELVYAGGISLTDTQGGAISIINRSTVAAIEQRCTVPLDPARFRGNLLMDAPPWAELAWVGRLIRVGAVYLKVLEPIERCAAVNINPADGRSDTNVPLLLKRQYGHINCGILCEVVATGRIRPGDEIALVDEHPAMADA